MGKINFAGKGLNQTIFSKKTVRTNSGKKSGAFKAIMENKEIAHVMDKRSERNVFYDALKKRGQAAGKKGITKNILKKVLGDIEHSGQFSHKEMHELGEELIGGAASSRIVRDHSSEHSESRSHETNTHRRGFDEVLDNEQSRHFNVEKAAQKEKLASTQEPIRSSILMLSKDVIKQANNKENISEIFRKDESVRSSHLNEINKMRGDQASSMQERIQNLKVAPAINANADNKEQGRGLNDTNDNDGMNLAGTNYPNANKEGKAQGKSMALIQQQIRELTTAQTADAAKQENAKQESLASNKNSNNERQTQGKNKIIDFNARAASNTSQAFGYVPQHLKNNKDEKLRELLFENSAKQSVTDTLSEKKKPDTEQEAVEQEIESVLNKNESAERQTHEENKIIDFNARAAANTSQAFGRVPQYLKSIKSGTDYDKIRALIAKVQEKEKGNDKEDDENENEDNDGSKLAA